MYQIALTWLNRQTYLNRMKQKTYQATTWLADWLTSDNLTNWNPWHSIWKYLNTTLIFLVVLSITYSALAKILQALRVRRLTVGRVDVENVVRSTGDADDQSMEVQQEVEVAKRCPGTLVLELASEVPKRNNYMYARCPANGQLMSLATLGLRTYDASQFMITSI